MDDVQKPAKFPFYFFFLLFLTCLAPAKAHAFGIDFLGEATQPLIGPAKDKLKKALVYVWLQPYAGYASGSSDQRRVNSSGVVTTANGLGVNGYLYGGRGGLLLVHSFRVGLDYSAQSMKRNTLVETTTDSYVQKAVKSKNTNLGAIIGLDIPHTPI